MRRLMLGAALAAVLAGPALAGGTPERPGATWGEIREQLWPGVDIAAGEGAIALDTPVRAEDAALVPVTVRIEPPAGRSVAGMVLIVEENPAPVAAEFEFGDGMGRTVELSTRLRVDAYSNVRVVARLDDGTLLTHAQFVKASGGCSAPAVKDAEAAMASVGRMKFRRFEGEAAAGGRAEAQVMVRHPNNSGFQMDQVTLLHIPAFFVDEMEVTQGGERLFLMSGGISISEDPAIRFSYVPNGAETVEVTAHDTDGGVYREVFPARPES